MQGVCGNDSTNPKTSNSWILHTGQNDVSGHDDWQLTEANSMTQISNKPSHHYNMAFQNVHTYKDVNTALWLQGLLQALLPKGATDMTLASSV